MQENLLSPSPLSEIIDNYQHLFGAQSVSLEKTLMEAFPLADFVEQGLMRYYPRMYRGLPRVYHRSRPTAVRIQDGFTHLPSLKRGAVSRALFSLYSKFPVQGKMCLLAAHKDDLLTASHAAQMFKARFPELEVVDSVSQMRSADLVLQISDQYTLQEMEWKGTSFEPRATYTMGLHFLEKGILVRKLKQASWSQVKNEQLQQWRNANNPFYYAHLATTTGGAIYLHALLKSLESDPRDIDLCTPDLGWLIHSMERQQKSGRPLLEWDLGVASIEVYFDGRYCPISLASSGKKVRILCPGRIDCPDSLALLTLSSGLVAVDDLFLNEAISLGKPFFYDGSAPHFMKNFVALAENRIGDYPAALACIRGMNQSFLYNLPVQEQEWVDETFFQELEEPASIALGIGLSLQDPAAVLGFKKLSQIIAAEFSANTFLCHLVQRALCHRKFPHIEQQEAKELALFAANSQSFSQLITNLFRAILC